MFEIKKISLNIQYTLFLTQNVVGKTLIVYTSKQTATYFGNIFEICSKYF